jgi:hypothetical protein
MSNIDGLHRFIDVRNENNTNVSDNQKSNNQPIANVDRDKSSLCLQFLLHIIYKFNYY